MVDILFQQGNGSIQTIDAPVGHSLMEAALQNAVSGVDGDCGGQLSCATCHVKIDADSWGKLELANEAEIEMLDFAENVDESSRLSCQIIVTSEMDGMVVHIPNS